MIISIQVFLTGNTWDDNAPVLHTVENLQEAVAIANGISHQLGNKTVRLCTFNEYSENYSMEEITPELVGRRSGTYIQSKGLLMSF